MKKIEELSIDLKEQVLTEGMSQVFGGSDSLDSIK